MTASLPWFRAYTEMVDDEKLRLLAFEDRWHFIALLCCKGAGLLDAGDPQPLLYRKLAVKLGLDTRALEAVALRLFEVDLIDPVTFQPVAWEQRQMKSDRSTDRVAAYRERMKQRCNVTGTAQDLDLDLEVDKDKSKSKSKNKGGPAAPTAKVVDPLPGWIPVSAWADWHTFRNSRKGWTAKARELSIRTLTALRDLGHDPTAVIEQSIERSWTGLFPIKSGANHATDRRPSAIERVEANIRAGQQRDGRAIVDGEAQRLIG